MDEKVEDDCIDRTDMEIEIPTIDTLLDDLGGCGLFQIWIVIIVDGSMMTAAWSMVFMAFGAYSPGWNCHDNGIDSTNSSIGETGYLYPIKEATTMKTPEVNSSRSCEDFINCKNVVFNEHSSTIVTEWNLDCDKSYIISLIMSMQMGGVLLGTMIAGLLNNAIGRRSTHVVNLIVHAVLNLVSMFSTHWYMFVALRIIIGMTTGSIVVTTYLYSVEFVTRKWRSIVMAIPIFKIGYITFSIAAMILRDWKHLHLATAVLTTLFILPVLCAPESLRWLAIKNKTMKAQRVGKMIAKVNKKEIPNPSVIDTIAEEERKRETEQPSIKILDLYRRRYLKRTLITTFMIFCNTLSST